MVSEWRPRYGGKILRLNLDGTACETNPFYDKFAPDAPRSSVYVRGVRNVFDLDFDANGKCFAVDNGKNIDRFFRVVGGGSYGWNGDPESIRINALYTWGPVYNTAPVGLEILDQPTLGPGTAGRCYVALYGPPARVGPNESKAIVEFSLDAASGLLSRAPEMLVQYAGSTKATVLGLAEVLTGSTSPISGVRPWAWTTTRDGSTRSCLPRRRSAYPSWATNNSRLCRPRIGAAFTSAATVRRVMRSTAPAAGRSPDLTHVMSNLDRRLNSLAYEASVKRLIAAESSFIALQRPKLKKSLEAKRDERIKVWLPFHLEEPRFDNPYARMPGFAKALSEGVRNDIITYLKTLR